MSMTDHATTNTAPARTATRGTATRGTPQADEADSPFGDLTAFNALPRLGSLAVSADGKRLVTVVSELAPDGKTWQGALWEVDPAGDRPARRLTRAAKGESAPVFTPDGSVLFLSARADPEAKEGAAGKSSPAALWLLPPTGEARQLYTLPGGVQRVNAAEHTGALLLGVAAHPDTTLGEENRTKHTAREDAGVTAILHESYPIRHWDQDVGPTRTLLATASPVDAHDGRLAEVVSLPLPIDGRCQDGVISPDGRWVAYSHEVIVDAAYGPQSSLRLVGADGAGDRPLAEQTGSSFGDAVFTPDSTAVICARYTESTFDEPPNATLVRIDLTTGEILDLTPDFPHWPAGPVPSADGRSVYFTSNSAGHRPLWRLELDTGSIVRLTSTGHYSDVCQPADGSAVYAVRSSVDGAPQPVRIDPGLTEQEPVRLPAPGAIEAVPGSVTEVATAVADGRTVRGYLLLPTGVSADQPAPLLLWVHGGPMMSWNGWSWRWNPWTAVARGYAVLLPDPALSTGYGQDFIRAGWGKWGAAPYTDLMAITDTVVARPDIDGERTAAMGGSFGGYMANWIATQTDRFRGIVTHASLWHLEAFTGTTDGSYYWMREMADPLVDPERVRANSPHLRVADIRTPMLVIHGDKDYRVPIGEGQRLYFDLVRHGVPARFLYFPTENHWVLTPGNSRVWYETVFAFLAEQVLGQPWRRPELL